VPTGTGERRGRGREKEERGGRGGLTGGVPPPRGVQLSKTTQQNSSMAKHERF
jgi:hypothetical protein